MKNFAIVGHKNPDTDSIVSAVAAKEYFEKVLGIKARALRAGEPNNETKFIFEKFGVEIPEMIGSVTKEDKVALVDHNEISQTFEALDFSQVEYIFDHHKLSLSTKKPIFLRNEPIGSTASLLAKIFFEKGKIVSEQTAKLLIAGILSDTLNLTSPTTTAEDKELVAKLNATAKIDIQNFVDEMFEAKSSLEGISVDEIINLDYKIYELGKYKVGAGTWETTKAAMVNEKKQEIIEALKKKKESEKLDYMFFMVVDILKQDCFMYIIDETEQTLAQKVFREEIADGIMLLKGVVSRKKQIIPPLTESLTK